MIGNSGIFSLIKSTVPMPVKNQLILSKWYLKRFPSVLQYYAALLNQEPIEKQVALLPTHRHPMVYWTELENIKLHGSLGYPPSGRLCMGGDWDITEVHSLPSVFTSVAEGVKKRDVHETIRSMFLSGDHYSKTLQYQAMMLAVEQKSANPPQGCYTAEAVDAYFQRLIAAFKSMQTHGYLTQKEQGKSSVGEIRLHITREGKLCLGSGGNHRIRMAELLNVRTVPFLLRGVHPLWVIQLCKQLSMPPHKAISHWLKSEFYAAKPFENKILSESEKQQDKGTHLYWKYALRR